MGIVFYAPLKPPDHPVPSGDRRMARLLIEAWELAGHRVEIASRLASRNATASPRRRAEIAEAARREQGRLLALLGARPAAERPEAWFTYHLYYKAPDWLGPAVAKQLGIPYLVAEASVAGKRAAGPFAPEHAATIAAVRAAACIFAINPADREGVAPLVEPPRRIVELPAFLDTKAMAALTQDRDRGRRVLGERFRVDPGLPWLLSVAMMRPGDKLASYRALGSALSHLVDLGWQLLVVGDGPARVDVEAALAPLGAERVRYLGRLEEHEVALCYGAADLLLWPAINEAYGMALLEAQAAGLAVVAGASGGVPSIIRDGETGLLAPPGDDGAFAATVRRLLLAPERRTAMAAAARRNAQERHDIAAAATILQRALAQSRQVVIGAT